MTDVVPEQVVDLDKIVGREPAMPAAEGLDAVDEQLDCPAGR